MAPKPTGRVASPVVIGGGLGGAIATVLPWVLKQFFDIDMPPNVAAGFAFILIALGGWIAKR